jgi:hypothetical protein
MGLKKQQVVAELTRSQTSYSMAELSWPMSEVTHEHLQNLVSQGYMTATKLATCCVPANPACPAPVVGYVMACAAF